MPLLSHRLAAQPGAVVLDVRPLEQFNICHLPGEAAEWLRLCFEIMKQTPVESREILLLR